MIYKNVWVSTLEYQDKFSEVTKKMSFWKAFFNLQKVPSDMPLVRIMGRKTPLVYISTGSLDLSNDSLIFEAKEPKPPHGASYENVNKLESFKIEYKDILKLSKYKNPKPYMKSFNLDWIQLELKSSPSNPYLLCIGTRGPSIKDSLVKTEELYLEMLKKKNPA